MNELINGRISIRRRLLTSASVVTLAISASAPAPAIADASGRPQVWIELGGQLSRDGGQPESYIPAFTIAGEQHGLMPVANIQSPPKFSVDENGSLAFQPRGSEWKLVVSVAYGRTSKSSHHHQENPISTYINNLGLLHIPDRYNTGYVHQTADYAVRSQESHAVVDFTVGKDVGVGLWKNEVSSNFGLGVRFAQFAAKTSLNLRADPNPHRDGPKYFPPLHATVPFNVYYQFYKATPEFDRSFRGWGPSLSYQGSVPIFGSTDEDAELTFDWGANAAILFGRQKTYIRHQTTADLYAYRPFAPISGQPQRVHNHYTNSAHQTRSRAVTVPNVGGLMGISLKFPNAKVSVGYRADFFLGAMDGGIDTPKSYDQNFYGPFAAISIGLP